MKAATVLVLGLTLASGRSEAGTAKLLIEARDRHHRLLSGLQFGCDGIISTATNRAGTTELELAPGLRPGDSIRIRLVSSGRKPSDWILLDDEVTIPTSYRAAHIVLLRLSEVRRAIRNGPPPAASGEAGSTDGFQRQALASVAKRLGLTEAQLEKALRFLSETDNPKNRALAAYLKGNYKEAEFLLAGVSMPEERDLVETLRYLGASQVNLGRYREAAATLRKALALNADDTATLSWLGIALLDQAEWLEAETYLQRALTLDRQSLGPMHFNVALELNNLASLWLALDRFEEAEPLLREALHIAEKSRGPRHEDISAILGNLGSLLANTDRLDEAERYIWRALAIKEKVLDQESPALAVGLKSLAMILKEFGCVIEARALLARALEIDERRLPAEHPNIARDLLLHAFLLDDAGCFEWEHPPEPPPSAAAANTAQPRDPWASLSPEPEPLISRECTSKVESLFRRAMAIAELSLGGRHPLVATISRALGRYLSHLDSERHEEAEKLLRRALQISEASYGTDHPKLLDSLVFLALFLKDTDKAEEAATLLRRCLSIQTRVFRATDRLGDLRESTLSVYSDVLEDLGRSKTEIEAALQEWGGLPKRDQLRNDEAVPSPADPPRLIQAPPSGTPLSDQENHHSKGA